MLECVCVCVVAACELRGVEIHEKTRHKKILLGQTFFIEHTRELAQALRHN